MRHVQVNLNLLRSRGDQLDQAVAAFLHVLRQGRLVLQRVNVALLDVQVARQCRQHQRLDVLSNAEVQAVDVGQLLAVLVDLPEVRITLHHHTGGAAGVGLGDHPRVDGRFFGVAPA